MVVAQPIEAVDLVLNAGEGTIGAVLSMLNESGHDIEVAQPALTFLDQIAKDSEGLFVLKNADGFDAVLGWLLKNYDAIIADNHVVRDNCAWNEILPRYAEESAR